MCHNKSKFLEIRFKIMHSKSNNKPPELSKAHMFQAREWKCEHVNSKIVGSSNCSRRPLNIKEHIKYQCFLQKLNEIEKKK